MSNEIRIRTFPPIDYTLQGSLLHTKSPSLHLLSETTLTLGHQPHSSWPLLSLQEASSLGEVTLVVFLLQQVVFWSPGNQIGLLLKILLLLNIESPFSNVSIVGCFPYRK